MNRYLCPRSGIRIVLYDNEERRSRRLQRAGAPHARGARSNVERPVRPRSRGTNVAEAPALCRPLRLRDARRASRPCPSVEDGRYLEGWVPVIGRPFAQPAPARTTRLMTGTRTARAACRRRRSVVVTRRCATPESRVRFPSPAPCGVGPTWATRVAPRLRAGATSHMLSSLLPRRGDRWRRTEHRRTPMVQSEPRIPLVYRWLPLSR